MAFLGEYLVSFTGVGRLVIPKKIREGLRGAASFTLSKGFDGCLSGYNDKDWQSATRELLQETGVSGKRMDLRRRVFSSAIEIEIDTQGRTIIPLNLLEFAGMKGTKQAIVIGVGNHFEIWQKNKWEKYQQTIEENISREKDT